MPAERLSMRKIREVLRLASAGHSLREVAKAVKIGRSTVSEYVRRARRAGLEWPLPEELDDLELEKTLFQEPERRREERPLPDWPRIHRELRRKHVTLMLLWEEYKAEHPDGLMYSQFCDRYRRWQSSLGVWMRQCHVAGEKFFADYSGDGIAWVVRLTGEIREAQLFLGVLGASNYTFAMATPSQRLPDWINAHVRAFEFLGGVPQIIVPDQPRPVATAPCRYEPLLNETYLEMARHFGSYIIPARPRKPRDKAKVEGAVLLAQRWIIAALRDRVFYSIEEINAAIQEPLEKLNNRKMRKIGKSRRELFLELDKPALKPLPVQRYEYADWKIGARVHLDYHVEFERNYYSVPYTNAGKKVDVRATAQTIEVFLNHARIASHRRHFGKHKYSTCPEHMPVNHRKQMEWTPERIVSWAQSVGPSTAELARRIMTERPHPEQGYRSCLGILRLEKRYGKDRLEKACLRAVRCRSYSYRSVDAILKNKLEDRPLPPRAYGVLPPHENVRGGHYYDSN